MSRRLPNMNRVVIALIVALGLATPPWAFAQARPDLSGTWRLNFDKSGPGVAGNGADVPFPSQLVITQSATELSVKRSSVRQAAFAAVYKLDGSRVNVEAPAGITETAEARFDGATLVIASRRSFPSPAGDIVVEFREILSVSGNVLTVKKTMTQDGESQTESAVYDKAV
jgi:hypothetical protein